MGEEVGHDHSKCAIKFCAIFGGEHVVDGNGIHGGEFGRIENELVLSTLLDKVVLQCEEYTWSEPGSPYWE